MATSPELLNITGNKRKLVLTAKKETKMAIEHLQVRDMERQWRLFEQQIEELHSCKLKIHEQIIAEREDDEEVFKDTLKAFGDFKNKQ